MNYRTWIFDCDGVILDSNKLKTNAFYQASLSYGKEYAKALVGYHLENGGVSRYRKFEYFLKNIIGTDISPIQLNQLLTSYASCVKEGLLTCTIAPGLESLRQVLVDTRWLILSGSDQAELRQIFIQRDIDCLFDGGIFGSPDTKDQILAREMTNGNIKMPAVLLGDSRYDYEAASRAGLDFIFVSGWSEWLNNSEISIDQRVESVEDLLAKLTSR